MKTSVFNLAAVVVLVFPGCSSKDDDRMQFDETEVLKTSVSESGEIRADDQVVSLQDLDGLLAANAQKNGVVWYHREAGGAEPSPQAMEVMKLIVKHRRPLSMSSRPDFSDVIDENGNSRPREK